MTNNTNLVRVRLADNWSQNNSCQQKKNQNCKIIANAESWKIAKKILQNNNHQKLKQFKLTYVKLTSISLGLLILT